MSLIINIFKDEVKDINNRKPEIILCLIGLHTQLMFAVEQQLERLQSLELSQFTDEPEYYESEQLDGNLLEDLGFDRFDGNIPEYVREYVTVTKQEPNHTTSITSIKAAINDLENLITAESTPTFEELSKFSGIELEILHDRLFQLIAQFNKYYPHVGVLHKQARLNMNFWEMENKQWFRLWRKQVPPAL